MDYYNALYALIGIQRKYGKDNAISFLMHDPFQVKRARAREMYNEAINLFFANFFCTLKFYPHICRVKQFIT